MKMQPLTERERLLMLRGLAAEFNNAKVNKKNWMAIPASMSVLKVGQVEYIGYHLLKPCFIVRLWNWLRGRQKSYSIAYHFVVKGESDAAEVGVQGNDRG